MPTPEYPLDGDTILAALEGRGLSYTIKEEDKPKDAPEGQSSLFSLFLPESDKIFAISVLSAQKDGERILSVAFTGAYTINAVSPEEFKDMIVFATKLFGGFENNRQIYDQFIGEYDKQNTQRVVFSTPAKVPTYPRIESIANWKSDVGDASCKIRLERPKQSKPEEYLGAITIASDWEIFYPDENDIVLPDKEYLDNNIIQYYDVMSESNAD